MALVDNLAIPINPIIEVCSSFTFEARDRSPETSNIALCKLNKDIERIQLALKGMAS